MTFRSTIPVLYELKFLLIVSQHRDNEVKGRTLLLYISKQEEAAMEGHTGSPLELQGKLICSKRDGFSQVARAPYVLASLHIFAGSGEQRLSLVFWYLAWGNQTAAQCIQCESLIRGVVEMWISSAVQEGELTGLQSEVQNWTKGKFFCFNAFWRPE